MWLLTMLLGNITPHPHLCSAVITCLGAAPSLLGNLPDVTRKQFQCLLAKQKCFPVQSRKFPAVQPPCTLEQLQSQMEVTGLNQELFVAISGGLLRPSRCKISNPQMPSLQIRTVHLYFELILAITLYRK